MSNSGRRHAAAARGVSLAETLIALTLMGAVLVPIMMFSSAWFMKGIASDRRRMAVSYGVSQFLNRLGVDLQHVRLILPTSTATALYYAYYDPLRDTEVRRGFRLTTVSGAQVLERLEYNESNGTWTAISPYADSPANDIRVNAGATFEYCTVSTCWVSTGQAMSVRLSGWTLTHRQDATQTVTLPTAQFSLSPGPVGVPLLSDTPRLLFSRAVSESFGSGASLTLSFLSGNESLFQNLTFGPEPVSKLHEVPQGGLGWGLAAAVDAPRDRVFFGSWDLARGFYVWSRFSGLSTLLTSGNPTGTASTFVDTTTGRVFMGEWGSGGNFYTWQDSTGLSTLASSVDSPGAWSSLFEPGLQRIYFGQIGTGSLRSWAPSTGLSTIISGLSDPGYFHIHRNPNTGELFFGRYAWGSTTTFYRFTPSSGLSTITTSSYSPGYARNTGFSGDRVVFSETHRGTSSQLWTWRNGSSLSTISSSLSSVEAIRGTPNGWFVIGSACCLYNYSTSTGLSTLISGGTNIGKSAMMVDPTSGRAFIGTDNNPGAVYTWHPTTGLSTLVSGRPKPMVVGSAQVVNSIPAIDVSTGRVVFSEESGTANVYTWQASTGLSTLLTGRPFASNQSIGVNKDGRWFFGEDSEPGNFYTWSPETGLSTLLTNGYRPGKNSLYFDDRTGRVYFSNWLSFHTWPAVIYLRRISLSGEPSNEALQLSQEWGTYGAAAQDSTGDVYLVDTVAKTLDRYRYNNTDSQYERFSGLNWTTWASTVGAMALDANGNGFALLDTGNKQIDVYSDRTVSGTPSAPTQLSLSGTTTPTGLAQSPRTGNYLVLDSALQSGTSVRLFVYNSSGTLQQTINIDVTASNLGTAATTETNFKIAYQSRDNILYLIAPTVGRYYALSLPRYL